MGKEIFLTFDMEWSSDEVLEYLYNMICELDICATVFVTHDTPLLKNSEKREGWNWGWDTP